MCSGLEEALISYKLYVNTGDRSLGYWLISVPFDATVLEFVSQNIGPLWSDPTQLVDTDTVNTGILIF